MPESSARQEDGNRLTQTRLDACVSCLNERQRQAVLHDDGPLLVAAGAGTGKTRTLATRVARLVADGVPAERVLLLTFTRRAAREMLDRARRLVPDARVGRAWGGTFHSVANRLLREYAPVVGLWPDFTILDQSDSADLLGLVRGELGHGTAGTRFPKQETLAAIYSRTVNAAAPLSEVLERHFPWCRDHAAGIREIVTAYSERKRAHNVCDFDDLLLYWRGLLSTPVAGEVAERFDHVLVDEYQDTNRIQADILQRLCAAGPLPTVVGDDAQAIYSFRAAAVENLREFPDVFPTATVVVLEENYRSTPQILAAANAVMGAATDGFDKSLWSSRPAGPRPALVTCADEAAEARLVCDAVLARREEGVALRDQAVLFRAGHHSDRLELELARRDVPFVKYGGLAFLEAAHVKDLLAHLRVLDNPRDVLAWHRMLLLLPRVGPATVADVLRAIGLRTGAQGPGDGAALTRFLDNTPDVPAGARGALDSLVSALGDCAGGDEDSPGVGAQIERLREHLTDVLPERYDDVDVRLHDFTQLAAAASEYPDRARFLAELTIDPPVSTSDLAGPPHRDDDWLVLSTIHSAKGGEWQDVYLIHASDGNIPSDMALSDREGVEEERRLLHVAMTRARDSLTISYPLRYYHHPRGLDDAHSWSQPSRFLRPARALVDSRAAGRAQQAVTPSGAPQAGRDAVETYVTGLFEA